MSTDDDCEFVATIGAWMNIGPAPLTATFPVDGPPDEEPDDLCDGAPTGVASRCGGRGHYETEEGDRYCDCAAGERLKDLEGARVVANIVCDHPVRNGIAVIPADRHDLAAIIPIAVARKPRSQRWLEAEIHNRNMRLRCHYSAEPFVEFWEGDRCIGRDPMPTIMLLDDDRALFAMPVEAPGPNCLDAMSLALGLTDAERELFRTRREDAAALLKEHGNHVRAELERTAPKPKELTP